MKKRILAAVLAAATAFSMFGASLSASAYIDGNEKYQTYSAVTSGADTKFDAYGTSQFTETDDSDESADYATFAGLLDTVDISTNPDVKNGVVYIIDYPCDTDELNALEAALNNAYAAVEAVVNPAKMTANEAKALNTAASALKDAYKTIVDDGATTGAVLASDASLRGKTYDRVKAANDVMAKVTNRMIDTVDWTAYGIAQLQTDLAAIGNGDGKYTSNLLDLANSYDYLNEIFGFEDLVAGDLDTQYEKELEKALALVESDYTTSNWYKIEGYIAEAEELYADGKVQKAIDMLKDAQSVAAKKADKTDLKAALQDLFTVRTISFPADYTKATNAKYDADDFKVSKSYVVAGVTFAYTDAFNEFAVGIVAIDEYGNDVVIDSYYNAAVAVYRNNSARQSQVDEALANLEDAVAALEITNVASEWEIARLETYLDEATTMYKEGDYRNNSIWKKFIAAVEDAEDILAKSYPGKREVAAASAELKSFIDKEAGYQLTPNSTVSLKRELKNLINDAKDLLKDTTDKPAAVILGLEKVVASAQKVVDNANSLVSNYEDAIATLSDAMDDYTKGIVPDVVTGWYYSDEAKAWFFYKEDGTEMTGWMWDASYNGWYYFREDGTMVEDCSKMIGGTWYYFWKGGKMAASAWAKGLDGKWYYYNASGAMATSSWILSSGKYYYVGSDGAMLVNTTTPDGYKVDANGVWVQ